VKVFILLGQANMLGFGRVGPGDKQGTLEYTINEKGKYQHLVDQEDKWTERKDMRYIHVMDKRDVDYRDMEQLDVLKNQWPDRLQRPTGGGWRQEEVPRVQGQREDD